MITDFRASQVFLLLHEAESVASIARRLKMSAKTVRKYRDTDQLPSQIERVERSYRTREDPLEALSAGLQDALHRAGGVPRRVRSDSLSAAVNNLSDDKEFATAYRALLAHYGVQGHRINVRKPHENGDVESSHGHLKDALDQALRLRGSRDFATAEDYMALVRQLVHRRNDERAARFREEVAALRPLPLHRRGTSTSIFVSVKSDSVIRVKRNIYSVSSKYIGLQLAT